MTVVPLIAVLISLAAFVGCVLVLSMSVKKWQTLKHMFAALVVVGALVAGIGLWASSQFHSEVVAILAGVLCVPSGLLAALITGLRHDPGVKKIFG